MSAKPKLRELALEMDQLSWSDVKSLAIQLDIGYATLRRIEDANQDISDPKNSTMEIWLETDSTASWKKIVRALNAIQKNELAKNIEKKYVKATSTPEPLATSIPASPEASECLPCCQGCFPCGVVCIPVDWLCKHSSIFISKQLTLQYSMCPSMHAVEVMKAPDPVD